MGYISYALEFDWTFELCADEWFVSCVCVAVILHNFPPRPYTILRWSISTCNSMLAGLRFVDLHKVSIHMICCYFKVFEFVYFFFLLVLLSFFFMRIPFAVVPYFTVYDLYIYIYWMKEKQNLYLHLVVSVVVIHFFSFKFSFSIFAALLLLDHELYWDDVNWTIDFGPDVFII